MNISRRDLSFIKSAMRAALQSSQDKRYKLGAVVVKSGRVLAWGYNSNKNRPENWIPRQAWSVHAEESCLRKIKEGRNPGSTLYVARVNRNGKVRLSRPCRDCQNLARTHGVERIVYTTDNGISVLTLN